MPDSILSPKKCIAMKTVRLGMSKLTVPDKIQKAKSIVLHMAGNPNFRDPNPTLEQVAASIADLEKAYEDSIDGGRSKRIKLRYCDSQFCERMLALAGYVQSVSDGEETIINSSGFDVRRATRSQTFQATNPSNVRGKSTTLPGEVIFRWKGAKGARIYVTEISRDGTVWSSCGMSTKVKLVVSGLEVGTKMMFRVAALSAAGQSGWSDPGSVWVIN